MDQQIAGIKYDLEQKTTKIRNLEREVFLLKKKNEHYDNWLNNLTDLVKHNLSKHESRDIQNAIEILERNQKGGKKKTTKKPSTKKPSTKKPSTKKPSTKKTTKK